jgi:hypothetical protein
MIPLATPRDNELLNLSQIVQVKTHPAGRCLECEIDAAIAANKAGEEEPPADLKIVHIVGEQSACTVFFSDGRSEIYDGDASKFLNMELHWALNVYRAMQQASQSNIVGPDGTKPTLVM